VFSSFKFNLKNNFKFSINAKEAFYKIACQSNADYLVVEFAIAVAVVFEVLK